MSIGQVLWEKALAFEYDNWTLKDIIDVFGDKWGVYALENGAKLYIKLGDGTIRYRPPD